jgi:hypothetical protein
VLVDELLDVGRGGGAFDLAAKVLDRRVAHALDVAEEADESGLVDLVVPQRLEGGLHGGLRLDRLGEVDAGEEAPRGEARRLVDVVGLQREEVVQGLLGQLLVVRHPGDLALGDFVLVVGRVPLPDQVVALEGVDHARVAVVELRGQLIVVVRGLLPLAESLPRMILSSASLANFFTSAARCRPRRRA